jgi:hypothetical protein
MIVCADDYGLREDIDEAILELCRLGKLSAVSCMVALQRCDAAALSRLQQHGPLVDLGLHLCLTDVEAPLSAAVSGALPEQLSFGGLLLRTLVGQVRRRDVFRQISLQYDLFVQKSGRAPSHIDGHLHAHQLLSVRSGLLDFLMTLSPDRRPYIRNTQMSVREIRRRGLPWKKAGLIAVFGARLKKKLCAAGLPTNEGFAGIYDFGDCRNYREYLPGFAAALHDPNGILVVHPGRQEAWRHHEFAALRSYQFNHPPNRFQPPGQPH